MMTYPPPRLLYAVSDSRTGPYVRLCVMQSEQMNPAYSGYKHEYASSAHQGIAQYGDQWYIAFQRDWLDGVHRQVCVAELRIAGDGALESIDPNQFTGQVPPDPENYVLDAFAAKREAEEFHQLHGVRDQQGIRQGQHRTSSERADGLLFPDAPCGAEIPPGARVKPRQSCKTLELVLLVLRLLQDHLDEKSSHHHIRYLCGVAQDFHMKLHEGDGSSTTNGLRCGRLRVLHAGQQ